MPASNYVQQRIPSVTSSAAESSSAESRLDLWNGTDYGQQQNSREVQSAPTDVRCDETAEVL